ncbi:MFS transporter [Desulfobacterium sp. N47]|uniref:MFS transporter n=1 Tax=Desulfobacterium sp. N47 TaxID=3115210 RepID=UPI003F4A0586
MSIYFTICKKNDGLLAGLPKICQMNAYPEKEILRKILLHNQTPLLQIRNIRLFILFRIMFNTRFYYPVFAILFLDFGLSLEQFALLNVAWAISIVLLEVPSGAMADIIGRRNLLVTSAAIMVVEISLLCFAPRGNITLLFAIFLANRILSGSAEACASGADEAIAYDTLKKLDRSDEWPKVLEIQMRFGAMVQMVAMILGALVYDPVLMQKAADFIGLQIQLNQGITMRFPLYMTLAMALGTLAVSLRMLESDSIEANRRIAGTKAGKPVKEAFKLTLKAGRWILQTPFVLMIILAGMFFDHWIRIIITLTSEYYRLIHLPEASFGLISAIVSSFGLFIPKIARKMGQTHTQLFNINIMCVLCIAGLAGMLMMIPFYGLIPAILLFCVIYINNYLQSYYLNPLTASEQRATVLSFKGLSFNLAYGVMGLLYAGLLAYLRKRTSHVLPGLSGHELEDIVFIKSLIGFPCYFIFALAGLFWFGWIKLKRNKEYKKIQG